MGMTCPRAEAVVPGIPPLVTTTGTGHIYTAYTYVQAKLSHAYSKIVHFFLKKNSILGSKFYRLKMF